MKFKSTVDRVVGRLPEADKQEVAKEMEERFLTQYASKGPEREKLNWERKAIRLADTATNQLLQEYSEKPFTFPEKNIYILDRKDWTGDVNTAGIYLPRIQSIFMQPRQNKLNFYKNLFHEMLHAKSYYAVQVPTQGQEAIRDYRMGLVVRTRNNEKDYFRSLNEGLTEELTKRYASRTFGDEMFRDEQAVDFAYSGERNALQQLCVKLSHRDEELYPSPKAVFDAFAKAMLNGDVLKLGRAIDQTFGKGTFRKIGEAKDDSVQLQKIVNSL